MKRTNTSISQPARVAFAIISGTSFGDVSPG